MTRLASLAAVLAIALTGATSHAVPTPDEGNARVKLIFSIDGGCANGIVACNDRVSLRRIVRGLQPLRSKYDVYVLLNPQAADKARLTRTLDYLAAEQTPFVLDVYSSDSYTLGANCPTCAPYDSSHGLSASMEELKAYKARYGKWFAGLRFMEVFGQDFTVRAIKTTNPEWARPGDKLPKDNVFQVSIAEGFIRFAKENGMFVDWGDFHWSAFAPWDKVQAGYEKQVERLLKRYPGVVTVTYDNNEPNEDSVKRVGVWVEPMRKFIPHGAAGFGLSDQSWLRGDHMKCPPEEIISWAQEALSGGCELVQFEPIWYFFNLPVGSFGPAPYVDDPQWIDRGTQRESLRMLIESLMAR